MLFIPEIIASIAVKLGEKGLDHAIKYGWPVPQSRHRKTLSAALRKMPLVYKDLALDVVTDFVDIRLGGVTPDSGKSDAETPGDTSRLFVGMRDFRRVVFVGEAGIGKTTMCRFAIQSIFGLTRVSPPIHPAESPLPFYVPLKAVDNSAPYPIQRYLLHNYIYLSGERGKHRLAKLAQARRLVLFLDGYDEASYSGGSEFLSRELRLLMGDRSEFAANSPQVADDSPLYRALREGRIWLTSRAEFLRANPVRFGRDVVQLEPQGVETHRVRLAKNIFEYHRKRQDPGAQSLNAELFIIQLAEVGDESLQSISHNPLFLTVLCYLYANAWRQGLAPKDVLRRAFYELIAESVRLLIVEIDEQKTLDMPQSERESFLARRAYHSEAKIAFLQHLSAQTYLQNRSVLDASWVLTTARDFFSIICTLPDAPDIARNLGSSNPSIDLIRQLVLSEIFLSVERPDGDVIYDFPHRRFREVLASAYWNNVAGSELLSARVADSAFSELIPTYVGFASYGKQVVQNIITYISNNEETFRHGEMLNNCIGSNSIRSDERDELFSELLRAVAGNSNSVVPRTLLHWCNKNSIAQWEIARQLFDHATRSRDRRELAFSIPVLGEAFKVRLAPLLESYWSDAETLDDFSFDMIVSTVQYEVKLLPSILRRIWPTPTADIIAGQGFARVLTDTYRRATVRHHREEILKPIVAHFEIADRKIRDLIIFSDTASENVDLGDKVPRKPIAVVIGPVAPQVWK